MNGARILAVDPGRTTLGVAVFEDTSLCYYAIKTLRVAGTPVAVRRATARVLNALIATYQPTHLAIEQPLVIQQRAELLAHVISAFKSTARHHGLTVSEYAPQVVRSFICADRKPSKSEVARLLAARYPELNRYRLSRSKWAEQYYERMFGAVAVGVVACTWGKQKKTDSKNYNNQV
jgi:Holliday junction resolvasome RuvABC endonuclease subunit